jgi:segregation and condensation protein B
VTWSNPDPLYGPSVPEVVREAETPATVWAFFARSPQVAAAEGAVAADGVRSEKLARLEAALFVADGALSLRKLVQVATLADSAEARTLLDQLNAAYDAAGSAFRVERVAAGFRLLTRPAYSKWLARVHQRQAELKLSAPALETLTVVAYRQPITRADVDKLRGVQSAEMIRQLLERGLVKICGEDDSLGRPYLYDTTRKFLEVFGLRTLDDLPMAERLRRKPDAPPVFDDAPAADE